MPKIFSDKELMQIKEKLTKVGRVYFEQYGLKKTNIEEITKEVGIAKGSFYKFFKSKEEFYYEILTQEEKIRDQFISDFLQTECNKEDWINLFRNILNITKTYKMFANIYLNNEMEILVRKIPQEKLLASTQRDNECYTKLISSLEEKDYQHLPTAKEFTGIFHTFFFMQFNKKEIGEEVFDSVAELLIDATAEKFIKMRGK